MADDLDKSIRKLAKKLGKIKAVEVPRANARALNIVAKRSEKRVLQGVQKNTKFTQKALRKRTYISRATAKKGSVRLTGYSAPISAVHLLTKNQLTNKMGTGTSRFGVRSKGYAWKSAFIQRGLNSNTHIFQRTGQKKRAQRGRHAGYLRETIKPIKISIQKHVEHGMRVVPGRIMKSDYRRILESDLKHRLNKYGR